MAQEAARVVQVNGTMTMTTNTITPMKSHKLAFALAVASVVLANVASAQNPPARPPATTAAPAPAARGGGGGRAVIRVMTLTSSAFADGGMIAAKNAQPGRDVSPPLSWSGAPDSTRSFVLIVHDIDAAIGDGEDDMLHWMVWNIPGSATSLPEGVPQGPTIAGMGTGNQAARQLSATGPNYRGPAAPATGPVHHYVFELYALDAPVNITVVGQGAPLNRAQLMTAMQSHVRGKAALVGLYRRPAP
jgi:Raf kinase inhibitor-like YbhB/YbcL family protein